jgi:hypothetical protein
MEQDNIVLPHYELFFNEHEIYEYLQLVDKEHLVFSYDDIKTFEDLQLFSQTILNRSVLGCVRSSDEDITVQYTNLLEKEGSILAVANNLTDIKLDEVKYTVSKLGYRLTNPLSTIENGIGVFGCSITYGIGMTEDKMLTTLLQQELKQPVHNFGIPGGSIQKIAKAFISINNFYKLKKAIFIIPAMHRFEYIGEELMGKKLVLFSESYVPSFEPINKRRKEVYEAVYGNFHDITFFDELIKMITLIKQNAKLNNTEVNFYTWDYKIEQLAAKYKLPDFAKSPQIRFPENEEAHQGKKVSDYARDGKHPGKRSQKAMADLLLTYSFNRKKVI